MIALVTGAGRGIGHATALTLARAGLVVIATVRDIAAAGTLTAAAAAEALDLHIVVMDVDDDVSVSAAFDAVLARFGAIDILVNNAGISGIGAVEEVPLTTFRRVMETNFFGALRCMQAVLPSMRERRNGCIINISSLSGRIAMAPQAPYAASKFALEAVTECLAQEMRAFNVRIALVEPGVIATSIVGSGARSVPLGSPYPQARRLLALFQASLSDPTSPFVVAERICEIAHGKHMRLRHPIGPDAARFLQFRADRSDEQIIDIMGGDDAGFRLAAERDLGLTIGL